MTGKGFHFSTMIFSLPGNLSDDSATKLPYYTGDDGEVGDSDSAPGSRSSLGWWGCGGGILSEDLFLWLRWERSLFSSSQQLFPFLAHTMSSEMERSDLVLCVHSHFYPVTDWICSTSQVALVVEDPPANAGEIRDAGLIPESGRPFEGGPGNRLQ